MERDGKRENGARLAFANPAARDPELFPAAAGTRLPATIIAATRRETPGGNARARQRDCGGQKARGGLIPRSLDAMPRIFRSRYNGRSRVERAERSVFSFAFTKSEFCPSDRMERVVRGRNFQVFWRVPIKREISPYTIVTLTIKREHGSNTA